MLEKKSVLQMYDNIEKIQFNYPEDDLFLGGVFHSRTRDFFNFIPCNDLHYVFGNVYYERCHFEIQRQNK
jgi:hypothetical protein